MAEEKTEGTQGASPAFDLNAVGEMFKSTLQEGLGQLSQQIAQSTKAAQPAPAADPVGDMVRPFVEGAHVAAGDAKDAAKFYAQNKDLSPETIAEIEKTFDKMLGIGRPMAREDILAWHVGKNFEKHLEDRIQQRDKKLAEAAQAGDAGGGSGKPGQAVTPKDPYSMSHEDLSAALHGISF